MPKITVLVAITVSMLAVAGCSKGTPPSGVSAKLTIIYTGNIGGLIDPCGCRVPLGGMARRSTALAAIKSEKPNLIVVDSGALLYEGIKLTPPFEPAQRARARLAVEEVKKMGIDAVNVSNMDLANSVDSLLAYGNAGLPWLSANIVWKKTGTLVFPPDTVRTAGGVRVGIFGLIDENTLGVPMFDESSPLKVNNPAETARLEIEKLKKTSDIIVALAYMDADRVEKLAADVPGIDIAVVSHTRQHNPGSDHLFFQPVKSGKTIIIRCPDGGRVIGRLDLVIANGSTDFTNADSIKDLRPLEVKEKDTSVKAASTYSNTFTDLDPSIPDDEDVRVKVDRAVKVWDDIDQKINVKR